jgi:ankyrin repeat protein
MEASEQELFQSNNSLKHHPSTTFYKETGAAAGTVQWSNQPPPSAQYKVYQMPEIDLVKLRNQCVLVYPEPFDAKAHYNQALEHLVMGPYWINMSVLKTFLQQGAKIQIDGKWQDDRQPVDLHGGLDDAEIERIIAPLQWEKGMKNIQAHWPKMKEWLDQKKVSVHISSPELQTALHFAVLANQLNIVSYLLEKGVMVNAQDKQGYTPLHYAAIKGTAADVVKKLLEHDGININLQNEGGWTVYTLAEYYGHTYITNELQRNKIRTNIKQGKNTWTAFNSAVHDGHADIVKELLENDKINFAERMQKGDLGVFHVAAESGHVNVVQALLEYGNSKKIGMEGPKRLLLEIACKNKNYALVALLLEHKVDLTLEDKTTYRILSEAKQNGHADQVNHYLLHTYLPSYHRRRFYNNDPYYHWPFGIHKSEKVDAAEALMQGKVHEIHQKALHQGELGLIYSLLEEKGFKPVLARPLDSKVGFK